MHTDLQVVVQILADTREIVNRRDPVRGEQRCRSHAGQLEDLRRSDAARREDRLSARLGTRSAVALMDELDALGPQRAIAAADSQPFHQRSGCVL